MANDEAYDEEQEHEAAHTPPSVISDASVDALLKQGETPALEEDVNADDSFIVNRLLELLATTDVHIGPGGGRRTHRLIVPAEGDVRTHLLETLERALGG